MLSSVKGLGKVPSPQPGLGKAVRSLSITLQGHIENRPGPIAWAADRLLSPVLKYPPLVLSVVSFSQRKGNPESSYQLHCGLGLSSTVPLCTPLFYLVQPWSVSRWPVLQRHRKASQKVSAEAWHLGLLPFTQPQEEVGEIIMSRLVLSTML